MGPDDEICCCYHVPYRKLWSFACRQRLQRASQLSECLNAGTGCGWCIPILRRIFEQSHQVCDRTDDAAGGDADVTGMTAEEYAARRQEYIRMHQPRNQF